MRFYAAGATGLIGGHLGERLVPDQREVVALVRSPAKAERWTAPTGFRQAALATARAYRAMGWL